ncbi:MAG: hypothetical protein WKF37_21015 [Bryobacteraceae bacterium]
MRERYPELSEADQEAVRQHAVAALNLTQRAKQLATSGNDEAGGGLKANLTLIQGVRKFAMDVRDLDIDLIDRINPFDAAYAVLAKAMDQKTLRQVQASIAARRVSIPYDEARQLAQRALQFKRERGRVPDISVPGCLGKALGRGCCGIRSLPRPAAAASSLIGLPDD